MICMLPPDWKVCRGRRARAAAGAAGRRFRTFGTIGRLDAPRRSGTRESHYRARRGGALLGRLANDRRTDVHANARGKQQCDASARFFVAMRRGCGRPLRIDVSMRSNRRATRAPAADRGPARVWRSSLSKKRSRSPTRVVPSHPAPRTRHRKLVRQLLPIEIGLDRRPLHVCEQHFAHVRHIGRSAANADQVRQRVPVGVLGQHLERNIRHMSPPSPVERNGPAERSGRPRPMCFEPASARAGR
ncbi:hypothetical protein A33K_17473 [Burkholderia humptydooensis MSMB43]|uniref:Uncharacterized protein n=1 Tax=Burkholderia humptydooensis MSMB43 TaxID=441157 RepID=A0ABN0G2I9_9BURK|nr:hypothetical protein A33K_17473 [Burkholderia humptydooensis MSMB43]